MDEIKCRTCLDVTDIEKCTEVTESCYLDKTVRDVIILLVPEMVSTLSDDELVCENCLRTLKTSIEFIERCLEVETIYAENREQFEDAEYIDDFLEDGKETTGLDENVANNEQYENAGYVDELLVNSEENNEADDSKESLENTACVNDLSDTGNRNSEFNEETVFIKKNYQIEMDHDYYSKHESKEEQYIKYESQEPVCLASLKSENDNNVYQYSNSAPTEIVFRSSVASSQYVEENDSNCQAPIQIIFEDSLIEEDEGTDSQNDNLELESDEMTEDEVSEDLQSETGSGENENIFSCSDCSQVFVFRDEYKTHLETHPSFVCHYCGKRLKNYDSYNDHIREHTAKNFYICEFCGKCFKCNSALSFHINSVHKEERSYMCDRCPKTFKNKFKLSSHIRIVHDKLGRQQCQGCGKLFQNKEACLNHYRLIHMRLKPFVCDICGLDFGRKDYLKKHMYHHTGEPRPYKNKDGTLRRPKFGIRLKDPGKPVSCKVCGKQISTVHLLKAHLQTHVRIKRYKCNLCELTFTLAANRDRHEKLHETDPDNKFRCNICWKRVKTEEELEKHVMRHDNRPPQHSCDICDEKFHRKYLLHNHLLDKHTGPGDIEKAEEEIVVKNLLEYVDQVII